MRIARRLFVVPLANNDHGKTTILNALLSQGMGAPSPGRKGVRTLTSPWGREIDALIFVRSFQETEKGTYNSVIPALDNNDPSWRDRELILLPSHITSAGEDIDQMIEAAHSAGFDVICASVLFTGRRPPPDLANILLKSWDERWTIPNQFRETANENQLYAQLCALGCDLWAWICRALAA